MSSRSGRRLTIFLAAVVAEIARRIREQRRAGFPKRGYPSLMYAGRRALAAVGLTGGIMIRCAHLQADTKFGAAS